MDINVQNFDAGAMAFVDDNEYSNLTSSGITLDEAKKRQMEEYLSRPRRMVTDTDTGVKVKAVLRGFRANPKQKMWINAFRKKKQEVDILNNKLKVAVLQGKQSEKKALENQLQSLLLQVKQLVAQNEDLLKKNSVDAIPKEVVAEEIIVAETPKLQPDRIPPNIDESVLSKVQTEGTKIEDIIEEPTKRPKWIVPALVIGVVAYLIFRNK
jgi:hypothetical protein